MQKFDLIVIGGGILGSFHAYHALNKGLRVLLLEKDVQAQGSTIQNFGQVVPSGLAGKWFAYGQESLKIYTDLQSKFDLSVRKNGSVYIASDESELAVITELSDIYEKKGYSNTMFSAKGTLAKYEFLKPEYVKGSIFFPQELSVEPNKMIYNLQRYMVEQMNLVFLPNTTAINCQENTSQITINTSDNQQFASEKVIICSGYEAGILFPEIIKNSGLVISKLQMLKTKSIPEHKLLGNILTGLTIRRYEAFEQCESFKNLSIIPEIQELIDWGIHILFKQAVDGSIIVGDSHEYAAINDRHTLDIADKTHVNNLIINAAEKIVKFTLKDKIALTWSGRYSQHPDEIFNYDVSPNIKIITGIGGKGMTSSAGFSKEIIEQEF
jgi:D-hydroxyproline dehydrogenase subunit beta